MYSAGCMAEDRALAGGAKYLARKSSHCVMRQSARSYTSAGPVGMTGLLSRRVRPPPLYKAKSSACVSPPRWRTSSASSVIACLGLHRPMRIKRRAVGDLAPRLVDQLSKAPRPFLLAARQSKHSTVWSVRRSWGHRRLATSSAVTGADRVCGPGKGHDADRDPGCKAALSCCVR